MFGGESLWYKFSIDAQKLFYFLFIDLVSKALLRTYVARKFLIKIVFSNC